VSAPLDVESFIVHGNLDGRCAHASERRARGLVSVFFNPNCIPRVEQQPSEQVDCLLRARRYDDLVRGAPYRSGVDHVFRYRLAERRESGTVIR
jgi:hypothetical protein